MIPRYQTNKQNLWKIEGREGPQKGLGEDESPGCHSRRPSWSLLNRFQGFPDLWQRDIYIHLVRVVAFITWHHHPQPVCLFNFLLYFPIQLCILLYKKWNFWRFFHFSFFICGPTHCSTYWNSFMEMELTLTTWCGHGWRPKMLRKINFGDS